MLVENGRVMDCGSDVELAEAFYAGKVSAFEAVRAVLDAELGEHVDTDGLAQRITAVLGV